MYAVTVTLELKPGAAEAFLPLILNNARTSLADEPGCLRFDVCTDPLHPNEVFLYELYYNRDMFDKHLATPHYAAFESTAGDLVIKKTVRTFAQVQG
jgi:quinol monooxygenase YgiN